MPKYSAKTYGRSRARETKSSTEFDELQKSDSSTPNVTSETNFTKNLPRKSPWGRTSRTVNNNASLVKTVDLLKTKKRRKLEVIEENDPFAFDESDVTIIDLGKSSLLSNATTLPAQTSATDLTDKSTDDEAYSSSQELSESSSQGGERKSENSYKKKLTASPFKSFLKNNNKSLSPNKAQSSRRLSALPTSADFSEDSPEDTPPEIPSVTRSTSWPRRKQEDSAGAVRVKRKEKPLFTVVQNVKQVHECLESGEDQQFFDDVEYLLDGLKQSRSLTTRCLSALDFASHCSQPSFRVSLRAHGIVPKIFSALQDAPSDKCLALCTSAIALMLTQDRQNVDLDKFILELMMNLLAVDSSNVETKSSKEYDRYVCKVRTLLEKQSGPVQPHTAEDDDINPASLVCESLVSLTSQRTGEWFKEGIRTLRGLDHIMDTVTQTVDHLVTRQKEARLHEIAAMAKLRKVTRCMKLLENVTTQNAANQEHLVSYIKGSLVTALARLLRLCLNTLTYGISHGKDKKPPDEAFEDCFLNILKVFLNLTHNFESGSSCVGQQDGFLLSLLSTVSQLPQFVTESKRFDLLVLSLGLMINLVEDSKQNIASLVQLRTSPCHESQEIQDQGGQLRSIEALVQLFLTREQAARNTDEMTSGLSTEEESSQESMKPTKDGTGWICGEDIDVSVVEEVRHETAVVAVGDAQPEEEVSLEVQLGKALQKAGKHMEDSVVAAYVALLLGCIVQDNQANQAYVRSLLPEGEFSLLVNVLRKFLGFMKLTSGTSGHAIEKIIKILESCQ